MTTPLPSETAVPASTPMTPAGAPRPRRTALITVGSAVAVLGLVGGSFALAKTGMLPLGSTSSAQPEEVIPATALGFARVDLNPAFGQKVAAFKLLNSRPETQKLLKDGDPKKALFEWMKESSPSLKSLKYDTDVAPWLGDRAGMAVVDNQTQQGAAVMALQVKDEKAATEGLAKLDQQLSSVVGKGTQADRGEKSEGAYFFRNGYAVITAKQDLDTVRTAVDAGTLASAPTFADDARTLGDPGLALMWADTPKLASMLSKHAGNTLPKDKLEQALATGRVVASVTAESDHVKMRALARGGTLPSLKSTLQDVESAPADSAVLFAASGAGEAVAKEWPTIEKTLKEGEAKSADVMGLAKSLGLNLPADLETLLGTQLQVTLPASVMTPSGMPAVAMRVKTDGAKFTSLLDRLSNGLGPKLGQVVKNLPRKVEGDKVTLGLTSTDVARYAGGATLASNPTLTAAVPDLSKASAVFYADLDAVERLYLSSVPADQRSLVEGLKAVSVVMSSQGNDQESVIRLFVN